MVARHSPSDAGGVDVLLVSLGTTHGLRLADAALVELLREAGASVASVVTGLGRGAAVARLGPGAYPLTDLVQAAAARRALRAGVSEHRPRAVVFSTTTAALLAGELDRPFAVWLDSPAVLNRPGRRSALTHRIERRCLAAASLVLPWSPAAQRALPAGSAASVVLPPPIPDRAEPEGPRERIAVAYAAGPRDKGLDLLCRAWVAAALSNTRLVVFGLDVDAARAFLRRADTPEPPGVEWRGLAPAPEVRAALRRATAFVSATRWEDFGLVQLEALTDGALLVCAPAGGAFPALDLARSLDPALVAAERTPAALATAIHTAFDRNEPARAAYSDAATEELRRYRPDVVARTVATEVLPRLLPPR